MVNYDMYGLFNKMLSPVVNFIYGFIFTVLGAVIVGLLAFFLLFCIFYHVNPFACRPGWLASLDIGWKPYDLMRWLLYDFHMSRVNFSSEFKPYGFTIFVGRQGSGKTVSMIQYLNDIHVRYPDCKIVTNFTYAYADHQMKDWRDFLEIRNGTDGVVFAIDEIHSEYSAESWKDFPESILSEISQQRKQRVKIVATAQVYSRCAKQIREQAFSVVTCKTYFGRFTFNREYDAAEYSTSDSPYTVKKRCKPISKKSFVQSNKLRECFDTFEKIERMKKVQFIKRNER